MAAYRRVDDLPAGWLPVHRYQLRAQCSVSSIGSLYLYLLQGWVWPSCIFCWPLRCIELRCRWPKLDYGLMLRAVLASHLTVLANWKPVHNLNLWVSLLLLSALEDYLFADVITYGFYRATQLCYRSLGSRNSVRLSHACVVTNPKNLLAIFLYHMKGQSF